MSGIQYLCNNDSCNTQMQTQKKKPATWHVYRNSELFQQCPNCGQFMVPVDLIPPNRELDRQIFFMFAGCINAYECNLLDQYDAECEQGKVMTKCFHAIHQNQDLQQEQLTEYRSQLEHQNKLLQKLIDLDPSSDDGKKRR